MQQRYYDPMIPRFLSVDPVTAYNDPVGQFHRYRYANNNPYRFTDPDGRIVDTLVDAAFTIYDTGRFLGAAAAYGVGKISGNESLANAGWEGVKETSGAVAVDAVAAVIPLVSVPMIKAGEHAASSAVQGLKLQKSLASEAQTAKVMAGKGEAIAGAGTKTELRDSSRLATQHGGNAADWAKVSGGNNVARDGTKIETHAYQNTRTGQVVEPKTKLHDEGQ